jgi:hypothetical protein
MIDSKGFWRWCITVWIIELLDFVHCPVFWKTHNVSKTRSVSILRCNLLVCFLEYKMMDKVQKLSNPDFKLKSVTLQT